MKIINAGVAGLCATAAVSHLIRQHWLFALLCGFFAGANAYVAWRRS